MSTSSEKLAASLSAFRALQVGGQRVFRSSELTRVHRDRLIRAGFLQRVLGGWLISSSPSTAEGESTPWLASFWEFCARYCDARFGARWHLSAEQSLLLHAESSVMPSQVVVYSPLGKNNNLQLLFDTSLYDLKEPSPPPAEDLMVRDGLRLFSIEAALVKVPDAFFAARPLEAQVAIGSVRDASGVLHRLLRGGHSVVAGRLVSAFRRANRPEIADEIGAAMRAAGYVVTERDPFAADFVPGRPVFNEPPIVGRLHAQWAALRTGVLEVFPAAPGLSADHARYLRSVDEVYRTDAYHSLSIEGYQVTAALIERVRTGVWHPETNEADHQSRNALAVRGYWQAFQLVKRSIDEVLTGAAAGKVVRSAHRDWYRELFQPSVAVGLIAASALAGYRRDFVFLRTSRYVPPRWEAVRDAMPTLFDLLETEAEPAVRAVLGHWLIGYIHPYVDGNGRIARFLMNVMLASGGYPWTIIRLEDRGRYLHALDSASLGMDVRPFATLIAERMTAGASATKTAGLEPASFTDRGTL